MTGDRNAAGGLPSTSIGAGEPNLSAQAVYLVTAAYALFTIVVSSFASEESNAIIFVAIACSGLLTGFVTNRWWIMALALAPALYLGVQVGPPFMPYFWHPADNVWHPASLVVAIYVICGSAFLGYLMQTAFDAVRLDRATIAELVAASLLVVVAILVTGLIVSTWYFVDYPDAG